MALAGDTTKASTIASYLALAISLIALGIVVFMTPASEKTVPPAAPPVATAAGTISKAELDRAVQSAVDQAMDEVKRDWMTQTSSPDMGQGDTADSGNPKKDAAALKQEIEAAFENDPDAAMAYQTMLMESIRSVVLEHMADKLDNINWADTLSQQELQKMLKRAARSSNSGRADSLERVDLSGVVGIGNQIDRILEEFSGINSYSSDNPLTHQITEMGDEAVQPLLERLHQGRSQENWAAQMAITDALEDLLTENDEDIILQEFQENGHFSKLIKQYLFPAAEDMVIAKIQIAENGYVDSNVIDAAMLLNAAKAVPLLVDFIRNGHNVAHAVNKLSSIKILDLQEPLRAATKNAENMYDRGQLVGPCLERGMSEGLELAMLVLLSTDKSAEYPREQAADLIRQYTNVSGTPQEMGQWLQDNRKSLHWNSELQCFE